MASWFRAVRLVGLVGLSVWLGGFAFYGGVVVPVLHEEIGSIRGGSVTQRVTDRLNAIGVATVVVWWVRAGVERRSTTRTGLALLAATSAILVGLIALHLMMDARLEEEGGLRRFYPLHRAYLIASTMQWFVNVGLLALVPGMRWSDVPARR